MPAKQPTPTPPEPPRETDLDCLEPAFRAKLQALLERMRVMGFDPEVYETRRSIARQQWLHGVGRTHDLNRKPVTWTMHSQHLPDANGLGQAADIIDAKLGWNNPRFFATLQIQAHVVGLYTIPEEQCHVQFNPPH